MEIVIKIPGYNLDEVQNGSIASGVILKAVKNGIPLPKGHGDLIDRDKFKPLMDEYFMDTSMLHYEDLTNAEHFNLGIQNCFNEIDEMTPVIKADNSEVN